MPAPAALRGPGGVRERGLLALLVVAALLAIAAAPWALDQPWLHWICKPLATLAVIACAWGRGADALLGSPPGSPSGIPASSLPRRWVLAGLIASLAGDVALMFDTGFVAGLLCFLLAHLAYLRAFTRVAPLAAKAAPFVAYALLAGAVLAALWPGVPTALRLPVLVYVICLAVMAAQAAVLWRLGLPSGTRLAPGGARLALGGALFVLSDALLATNRFAAPLPMASLWVLSSYWAAQWLIATALPPRAATTH